jgi:hypothetical protein
MRDMYYKLIGREVVPATREDWCTAREGDRHVAIDDVGPYWISTVFLGLDHRFGDEGPPLVFETMVFKGSWSGIDMARYSTYEEAEAGHAEMVAKYRGIIENAGLHAAMRQGDRHER